MAAKQQVSFDELTKLASEFVTAQQGIWGHAGWLGFLERVQESGVDVSADMQATLGNLLEAMKEYHTAVSSTEDIEKAMNTVFDNSVAFVKRHQGVWGHADWEDYVRTMQDNTSTWSESMDAYLGGVLESLKAFYALYPAPDSQESAEAATSLPAPEATATSARRSPASMPDDLTALAGLGPAMAKKLNQEGIVSYAQLAALSETEIAHLEKNVIKSTGCFKRNDWLGQAKKRAQGVPVG
jgi:predicted flap endonuclease-1-like 5' DNA nuclease